MAKKVEVHVNIDGINLYCRHLVSLGKDKAIDEIVASMGKNKAWAEKAWVKMTDEVKKADEEVVK